MATMIPLSYFESLVQPSAPEAPLPVIGKNLRLAAIEFSEKTRAWRQIRTVTISRQEQAVIAPLFASIIEFENAYFDGETELTPIQFTDFAIPQHAETGHPQYITQIGPDRVSVLPFAEGTLTVSCFLRPRHDTEYELDDQGVPRDVFDTVPDFYLSQYGEVIAAGALHRLFMMPRQPFTDPQRANYYLLKFQQGCDRHHSAHMKGQVKVRSRVTPHYF